MECIHDSVNHSIPLLLCPLTWVPIHYERIPWLQIPIPSFREKHRNQPFESTPDLAPHTTIANHFNPVFHPEYTSPLHLVVTQTKEPYERGMYPTISFPSSWDPAQPSTPSSSHRLWYRRFRVWYDHPLKVGHHSLCSFLNRRAIAHSTGKAMGDETRIVVRYLIGLFFTTLTKRVIQWSELWFSPSFGGWER